MENNTNEFTGFNTNVSVTNTDASFVSSNGITNYNSWFPPERIKIIENTDSIEFIYIETSCVTHTIYPQMESDRRVFKIIFSCKDGKWHKSDRIYGEIIPASDEDYIFDV